MNGKSLGNYLDEINNQPEGVKDFCTTANIDEDYIDLLPDISKQELWILASEYNKDHYSELKERVSNYFGAENILLGAGSEDLLVSINNLYNYSHFRVGILEPIFYRVRESLDKASVKVLKTEDLDRSLDLDLVWLNNPNAINGEVINRKKILEWVKKNTKTLFVVDEAAMLFMDNWKDESLLCDSNNYENLIVLGSLSKIYGIPGLRVGFLAASFKNISKISLSRPTYPITNLSAFVASRIVRDGEVIDRNLEKIKRHKKEVVEKLSKIPDCEVYDSPINCVFVYDKSGTHDLYQKLLIAGVGTLDLSTQKGSKYPKGVRITVHSSDNRQSYLVERLDNINK